MQGFDATDAPAMFDRIGWAPVRCSWTASVAGKPCGCLMTAHLVDQGLGTWEDVRDADSFGAEAVVANPELKGIPDWIADKLGIDMDFVLGAIRGWDNPWDEDVLSRSLTPIEAEGVTYAMDAYHACVNAGLILPRVGGHS